MPSYDPKYDVGRAVRGGIIAVSFIALTAILGGDIAAGGSVGASAGSGGGSDGGTDDRSTIGGQGGMEDSDISSAFQTLSRPQQARVLQRCKDVVARPALVDPNQLTVCQMLLAMAKQ
ncbi:MAG: hypothetical protein QOD94_1480 [Alphaproteobacteria bacterium]|nr:hypothetical protein [Alphaproteobacteria bacterium]